MTATEVERLAVLESQQKDTRSDIHAMNDRTERIEGKLDALSDQLHNESLRRVPWSVTVTIGVLSSTCTGLIVALASTT